MKISLCILAAACVAVALAGYKSEDFSDEERWEATLQGLEDAKKSYEEKAKSASASKDSATLSLKFFRKASARANAIGKARIVMEDAVKRAEHILLDKKRIEVAKTATMDERAEILAEELYHKPGSVLSQRELVHIDSETCQETRMEKDCEMVPDFRTIRTISGICNNLENPLQGASMTPFRRLINSAYSDGISALFNQADEPGNGAFEPPSPSARLVSDTTVIDREVNDPETSHLIMQWGQFVDHDADFVSEFENTDCDLSTCEETFECAPVRVPNDDQDFGADRERNGQCLPFVRSIPACPDGEEISQGVFPPREHLNQLTHYLDGSMVYGSTEDEVNYLREFSAGRLLTSEFDNLPIRDPCEEGEEDDPTVPPCCMPGFDNGCFFAGDRRVQEHASLTAIHTLFVREHNRIAGELAQINEHWNDNRLFTETRTILIALLQRITYSEYLPTVFGSRRGLISRYTGYNPNATAAIPNAFAAAAYRFGHSQIQPVFDRLNSSFQPIEAGSINLVNSFFSPTAFLESKINGIDGTQTDAFFLGLTNQPSRLVDEFLNSVLTSQLFETTGVPGTGMDLATLNIQRGRDHGLPRYGRWKEFCKREIGRQSNFRNQLTRIRLMQLYGMEDNIDLFVGALAEEPLAGSKIGATLACIFKFTFENLRDGDRFYYENRDISTGGVVFTDAQLREVRKATFSRIICDNTNEVVAIRENPFLLTGPRRLCDGGIFGIPNGIDFTPWREDLMCSYRTIVETNRPRSIRFFTNTPNPIVDMFADVIVNGRDVICMPYICPTRSRPTTITIVEDDFSGECRDSFGSLFIRRTVTLANSNDVGAFFSSVEDCEAAPMDLPPAFSYGCGLGDKKATMVDLEKELASILQTENNGDIVTPLRLAVTPSISDQYPAPTPFSKEEVKELETVDAVASKTEKKEDSEDALISLLQETLQQLRKDN